MPIARSDQAHTSRNGGCADTAVRSTNSDHKAAARWSLLGICKSSRKPTIRSGEDRNVFGSKTHSSLPNGRIRFINSHDDHSTAARRRGESNSLSDISSNQHE